MRVFAVLICCAALGACAQGEASFGKFAARHAEADLLKVTFVKQRDAADCGPAALTSVGLFWGAAESGVWPAPARNDAGYAIGELREASARLGLASTGLLEAPDYVLGLVEDGMPVVAPIAKPYERRDIFDFMLASMVSRWIVQAFVGEQTVNHHVVVLGLDERYVYALDPQDGYRAIERDAFLAQWRGVTDEFVPEAQGAVAAFVAYRPQRAEAAPAFDLALAGADTSPVLTAWALHP